MSTSKPSPTHDVVDADVVAVAGDWHGDSTWAPQALRHAAAAGIRVVLHAGDFGIWPGDHGARYLQCVHAACVENDQVLLVTPGNHEDFDQIGEVSEVEAVPGVGAIAWFTDRIGILPRGHRITFQTQAGVRRTVVSLGGGPSLDFEFRTRGVNWWPAEEITAADVEKTAVGGFADIMVAHDAPGVPYQVDAVADICGSNGMGWSHRALLYAAQQRMLMTHAFEAVAPAVFFHGHYHARGRKMVDVEGSKCEVVCLPHQGQAGNIVALDLTTLEVSSLTNPSGF